MKKLVGQASASAAFSGTGFQPVSGAGKMQEAGANQNFLGQTGRTALPANYAD
jgi:hypothetical protein